MTMRTNTNTTANVWRDAIECDATDLDLLKGSARRLADLIFEHFDVEVHSPEQTLELCRQRTSRLQCEYSEATWRMVVKATVLSQGLAEREAAREDDVGTPIVTCVFHFGFLGVIENDEHLAMLAGRASPITGWTYPPAWWQAGSQAGVAGGGDNGPGQCESASPARSRVFRTNELIAPIDRVAARVAPPPCAGPAQA